VILYRPPGVTVHQALDPPYPNVEIALWGIFQFQIVVADAIMVRLRLDLSLLIDLTNRPSTGLPNVPYLQWERVCVHYSFDNYYRIVW